MQNNPLLSTDPTGTINFWEFIPIIKTIYHLFATPPGAKAIEYASLGCTKEECRFDRDFAEVSCMRRIDAKALENLKEWSLGLVLDVVEAFGATIAWGMVLRGSAALSLGATATGVGLGVAAVLTLDSIVDAVAVAAGLTKIKKAAEEAKETYCNCDRAIDPNDNRK